MSDIRFGRFAYDWRDGINVERMRRERLERARASMKAHGLEAMLCMDSTNVRYITSTITPPWMIRVPGWRYCLLVRDEDPVLWEHGDIRHITKAECSWLSEVKYAYTWMRGQPGPLTEHIARTWAADIKKELVARGVKKVGLDVPEAVSVRALQNEGIEVTDCQQAMLDARIIKTKDELNCLKIAAAICEAILEEVRRALKPGITELHLTALGYKVGYEMGMDDIIGFTVCSGPNAWPNFKFYTDRIIRPGDTVTFDIGGASYNGYKTCYYRTFSLGQPSPKIKEFYREAYEWIYSAIRKIKPGATTADLVSDWPDATKEWGYDSEWEAIANEWGHGLGLALYEPPTITRIWSREFPVTLKEGMTFALETQQGTWKDGGVRIEEMVAVTSSGVEVLSKWPVEEITIV
ncbi:Xaa-Pro peptidase family protein [Candidatus Hecatella orcuttiae]|jgi:Xaa-Pro dipeptidase|uniref:Xaa-Pro peptidase family protein n=1 Tax=Candidatus Hecatella orcuttiae TaxID=1935119 RepID=UPI0028680979|nr:Xaa-Pro peptidase family protein [Candidatus Hecatella orcuttiae]